MGNLLFNYEEGSFRRNLFGFWRPLINLVFPPVCPACGRGVARHAALCTPCWTQMRFIERPYCEVLGIPFTYDPGPGFLSAEAIADPPDFTRLRTVAAHEGPAMSLVHALKYRDRTDLAPMMAAWMLRAAEDHVQNCEGIVPVPLHWTRLASRRFNQSAELARHLARLSGRPYLPVALMRRKRTERQVGLTARARQENVRAAFAIAKAQQPQVFGRRLVLVDDVYTTGATVSAAAKALQRAGAAEITVLTFAMALRQPI